MRITRRQLIQRTVVGASGLASGVLLQSGHAESTPSATSEADDLTLLARADDILPESDEFSFLAIMDAGAYETAHVPGMGFIPWEAFSLADTSEASVEGWTSDMRQLLSSTGIRLDRPVVAYDEGTLFAARGWWQLAYLGYRRMTVLDGGLSAWREAGGEIATGLANTAQAESPVIDAPVRRELLATKEEVLTVLDDPGVVIVDARSPEEYGEGHIPGAVNVPYTSNALGNDVNLYLPGDHLKTMYEELGMTSAKRAITYCSTGVRGSVASFAMRLGGFEHVALYVGSWNEWSKDPDAPVE